VRLCSKLDVSTTHPWLWRLFSSGRHRFKTNPDGSSPYVSLPHSGRHSGRLAADQPSQNTSAVGCQDHGRFGEIQKKFGRHFSFQLPAVHSSFCLSGVKPKISSHISFDWNQYLLTLPRCIFQGRALIGGRDILQWSVLTGMTDAWLSLSYLAAFNSTKYWLPQLS